MSLSTPVSAGEFALFIREGEYFKPRHWNALAVVRVPGGDHVLERIGFAWNERAQPVKGVSWFEADAFCRSHGGRLPYYQEYRAHKGRLHRGASWFADWFHPNYPAGGAHHAPQTPPRRMAVGFDMGVDPNYTEAAIGLCVMFDNRSSYERYVAAQEGAPLPRPGARQ